MRSRQNSEPVSQSPRACEPKKHVGQNQIYWMPYQDIVDVALMCKLALTTFATSHPSRVIMIIKLEQKDVIQDGDNRVVISVMTACTFLMLCAEVMKVGQTKTAISTF